MYKFYCHVIDELNLQIKELTSICELPEGDRRQAIASALMAHTAHYFGNTWCIPKDQFVQMAAEEYDLHQDKKAS